MFEALIKRLAKSLGGLKIPYMIIGGQAVLLYGAPRMTKDIDITLGLDIDSLPAIKKICSRLGLKIKPKDAEEFVKKTMVLPVEDPKTRIRVDFIFSFSAYEKEAIERAVKVKVKDYYARFASIDDVIIHKIFAGREIDLVDVRNIIDKMGKKKIDTVYIKRWLKELQGPSCNTDLLTVFNKTLTG
ncbi:MAG: nucleotidyl transferase AbiEii/AbiGii toxin family protein [Nitrospirae bacterium]|nr:nucleotidyl transferase AbiEii/AbiGii toxin family protein [Nitrospirota bacterium]